MNMYSKNKDRKLRVLFNIVHKYSPKVYLQVYNNYSI